MADTDLTATLRAVDASFTSTIQAAQAAVEDFTKAVTDASGSAAEAFKASTEEEGEAAKTLKEQLESLRETIRHLAEAFGVFEAFRGLKELAFSGLEASEELNKLNSITGISMHELQSLRFAADTTGVSFEMAARAVEMAGYKLLQLRSQGGLGTDMRLKQALSDLSLKPEDLGDSEHILEKVAAGIDHVHNSMQRIGDVRAIFGNMGVQMMPMLESLNELDEEFKRLGITVEDFGVAKAWMAQEAWNKLDALWHAVELRISADLAPALQALADALTLGLVQLDHWLASPAAKNFGKDLVDKVIDLAKEIYTNLIPALTAGYHVLQDLGRIVEIIAHPINSLVSLVKDLGHALGIVGVIQDVTHALEAFGLVSAASTDQLDPFIKKLDEIRKQVDALPPHEKLDAYAGNQPQPFTGGILMTPQEQSAIISARAKAAESVLAISAAMNRQLVADGQASAAQEIQTEVSLANQKYTIQANALKQQLAIADQRPSEILKLKSEEVSLENQHAAEVIGLDSKLATERAKIASQGIEDSYKARTDEIDFQVSVQDQLVRLDKDYAAKAIAIKQDLEDQKYKLEKEGVEKRIGLSGQTLDEQRKLYQKLLELAQKDRVDRTKELTDLELENRRVAQEAAKDWDSTFQTMGSTLDNLINTWIEGGQRMSAAFKKTAVDIMKSFIESGLMGLLVGGEHGSITESIFGTKGGGSAVQGGLAGMTGLGGGLAGLFSRILPEGLGSLLTKLTGIGTAGPEVKLNVASDAIKTAADGLKLVDDKLANTTESVIKPAAAHLDTAATNLTTAANNLTSAAAALRTGHPGTTPAAPTAPVGPAGPPSPPGAAGFTGPTMPPTTAMIGMPDFGPAFQAAEPAISAVFGNSFQGAQSVISSVFGLAFQFLGGGGGLSGLGGMLGGLLPLALAPFGLSGGGVIPSAAMGMVMPDDGKGGRMAVVHPNEMVLPANLSDAVQNMATRGEDSGPPVTIHAPLSVNTIDARGMEAILQRHADTLSRVLLGHLDKRGGRLKSFKGVGSS